MSCFPCVGAKGEKVAEEAHFQSAANDIRGLIKDKGCGPIMVRLAWHDAGTFEKSSGTGGPHGHIRFKPESGHACNNGLDIARNLLQPLKDSYPQISYADFFALAGTVAIEAMEGPAVPFRPGRSDDPEEKVTPDGRLPDAAQGASHLRDIFYRMGLGDEDIVALSGAHSVGRCHKDRSGFDGPWSHKPLQFDNDYFKLLVGRQWVKKGKQYECKQEKGLMMLETDVALMKDSQFKPTVEKYAKDKDAFFKDFSASWQKLIELGYGDKLAKPLSSLYGK